MMAKESISLLFVLAATACALKCNNYATVKCGKHDAQYDTLCAEVEKQSTEAKEVTCGDGYNRCASGETTFSFTGLELTSEFGACSSGETGCLKDVKEAVNDQLESSLTLNIPIPGITVETKDFCICEKELCNTALYNACPFSVLLFSLLLAFFL